MNLHKMIEICLKYDNMHIFVMINALICINNYVITCIISMLSDARLEMYLRCLLLPRCGDAISGPPQSFRCPSCLLSPSQILGGAAPILLVVVWPLSWRASTSGPHDQ